MSYDADVVIAGAGPTGLITALGLVKQGLTVRVLEQGDRIVPSPRAMVYHYSVLPGLAELGLLGDMQREGFEKRDYEFRVFRTQESVRWNLDVLNGHVEYPFNIHLGQHRLGEIALGHLQRHSGADVIWGAAVTSVATDESGAVITFQTGHEVQQVRARWCIGADGARSTVRQSLGLAFEGMTWPERFVATNVYYDFLAEGYARSVLLADPDYGAIVAQIDEAGLWRVTYSEDGDLPDDELQQRMTAYFRVLTGGDGVDVDTFTPYRMHQRAAETFRVGRVLLAGDAAHATNPTGGLGLTSGLFDAYALVPRLVSVVGGGSASVLDEWATDRKRVFWDYASPAASNNKRMIYSETDPVRQREDLERLQASTEDPDKLRERLRFTEKLQT